MIVEIVILSIISITSLIFCFYLKELINDLREDVDDTSGYLKRTLRYLINGEEMK